MKKYILILAVLAGFTACKTESKNAVDKEVLLLNDSNKTGNFLTDTGITTNEANQLKIENEAEKINPSKETNARRTTQTSKKNTTNNSSNANTNNSSVNNSSSTSAATTPVREKNGMSKAAKGAIIGGTAGAIGGAVIGKNVKGAAIGAAAGAAGGYIIGRKKDKKEGRVD